MLFAEGTSTRRGLPVHYASLSYRTPPGEARADSAVCWWGDMTFPKHFFGLLKLKGFRADLAFGEQAIVGGDRKALAGRLWAEVVARFVPVG